MHINLSDGKLNYDDSVLGEHEEAAFVRGAILHHTDEQKLRTWAQNIYRQNLANTYDSLRSVQQRIAALLQKLDLAGGVEDEESLARFITERVTLERIYMYAPMSLSEDIRTWCADNGYDINRSGPPITEFPKLDTTMYFVVAEKETGSERGPAWMDDEEDKYEDD